MKKYVASLPENFGISEPHQILQKKLNWKVRPGSVRPDGLEMAGIRFAEARLASSTGPVFNADDLPEGQVNHKILF